MKRIVLVVSIMAIFGFANAQFQGGLTNEVPNLRVSAMGGVYSLIETSNYADFPQRILLGGEGAWLGRANTGVWGLARFQLNNFLELPMPMAWQVSVEQSSMVTINDLFDHVGLGWFASFDPLGEFVPAYEATNRINSNFAIGLQNDLIAGLGLKMYSNSNSFSNDTEDMSHSFFGLETTWGLTMILEDNTFLDASIDFDYWKWDADYTASTVDQYMYNYTQCDGVFKFGLNGRYYKSGDKVDYSPYMKFSYFSFSSSEKDNLGGDPPTIGNYTYDGSVFDFQLGSGIHYKPSDGVKVYNEFEFRYQSVSQEVNQGTKEESSGSVMTLLPIYRMGVELTKDVDPKIWWGFNSVQLWGGFNKTFTGFSRESGNEERSEPTFTDVSVTTGAALQNGNFKFEFYTTVGALRFDDYALNNVAIGLVYMFEQ